MFDPAKYIALKPYVTGLSKVNGTISVSVNNYDSLTGVKGVDTVIEVNIKDLKDAITAFKEVTDNYKALIQDAGA